jgi:DNA-binding NarL/FixJ family response regulator
MLPTGYQSPTLETIKVEEVESDEQRILEMLQDGCSYRQITTEIYGQVGTFYNAKIDKIAKKYNVNN